MTAVSETGLTVQVERKPQSEVELQVEAAAEEFEAAVQRALGRLARQVKVPGFRPGKAPAALVEKRLGWPTVRQEAVEELLPQLYYRALDENGLEPVTDPEYKLEAAERGEPFRFRAGFVVKPDVDLGNYLSLRVEEKAPEVTDAEVDETVEQVRRRHSTLTDVTRAAQVGDVLQCKLIMRRGEETLSDDGERELELDPEKLLPGLTEGIIGMNPGAQRSFQVTLPDDYPRPEVRGQTVDIDVEVMTIRERQLPPLDDSLAGLDEHGQTLAELRDYYRQRLLEFNTQAAKEKYEGDVLTALRDHVKIDIPQAMIDREINREIADLEYRLSGLGIPLPRYLEMSGSSMEKLRAETHEQAVQRVKLELALDQLAAAENIEIDESQVELEEKRLSEGRKLTALQKRRLHLAAHVDLRRRAAGQRLLEICRGEA